MRNQKMNRNLSFFILLWAVFEVNCFNLNSRCEGCRNEYTRMKRAKFYQSPPTTFYNRPPFSAPIRGAFSYTPPPGYIANEVGSPPNFRPYKVSKRPVNEGLGDDDINNLVKYLSKRDLDKVIQFASELYGPREPISNINEYPIPDEINNAIFKNQDFEGRIINLPNTKPSEMKYLDESLVQYSSPQLHGPINGYEAHSQRPAVDDSDQDGQFSFLDAYIQKEIREMTVNKSDIYTDNTLIQEEPLPKPINLRENDYQISFSNNVQTVAKPETIYKLENFADLPLMEYHDSKLYSVSSYSVPHYSVTSGNKQLKASTSSHPSNPNIPVEPAPPASVAKDQSEAHLKAIKIWTHKSKGTAYTLHDDGTLTLEKPFRPKHY